MVWRRRAAPMRRTRFLKKRRFSRKSYARSSRSFSKRRKFTSVLNRNPITADVLFTKLRFNYNGAKSGGNVASTDLTWRGNSIYDPDYSGTGTQPMGYDQYSTLYDYVVVMGSKINFKILPGADTVCQFCVYPSLATSATTVALALREIPYGRTKTGGIYNIEGNGFFKLSNYMTTAKMFCVSKQHVRDTANYSHSTATNPTNPWYWHLTVETQSGGAAAALNFTYDVWIDYYVMFKRRTVLALS